MTAIRDEVRFLLNDREVRLGGGVRSSDTLWIVAGLFLIRFALFAG